MQKNILDKNGKQLCMLRLASPSFMDPWFFHPDENVHQEIVSNYGFGFPGMNAIQQSRLRAERAWVVGHEKCDNTKCMTKNPL